MRTISTTLGLFITLGLLGHGQTDPPKPPPALTFRDVHVRVIEAGTIPAAPRKVDLIGLETSREPVGNEHARRYWHAVTDAQGAATFHIGNFEASETELHPAWGLYAVVVQPTPQDAGGVSSRFWFDHSADQTDDNVPAGSTDWGTVVLLPDKGLDLPVTVERGFTFKGRLVEDIHPGKPLTGVDVRTHINLHGSSGKGVTSVLFDKHIKTDANGDFVLLHQFPNQLHVNIYPVIWLKTKVNEQWQDQIGNTVYPPADGGEVFLDIGGSLTSRFKYYGTVLDSEGKPMPKAKVTLMVTSEGDQKAPKGEVTPLHQTLTKADGSYELMSPTPYVTSLFAEGPDKTETDCKKSSKSELLPPGEYDLSFSK